MPAKTPPSSEKTPAKGKNPPAKPEKSGAKPAPKKTSPAPAPAASSSPLFGELSPERKLDLVGAAMAVGGVLMLLSLFSGARSPVTSGVVSLFAGIFGWGVYVTPIALIGLGGWFIFRNVSQFPPLTAGRIGGILLLFVIILISLHWIGGGPELSYLLVEYGEGGGRIGHWLLTLLYAGLGAGGTFVVLLALFIVGVSLTLDQSIPQIFLRLKPVWDLLVTLWNRLRARLRPPKPAEAFGEFTPLARPEELSGDQPAPNLVAGDSSAPAPAPIVWKLPTLAEILDSGETPSANEDFIQQRARLIEETLASFGAPAQVVEINRGPSVTQFGVEPLFLESRSGRMRVRVSKIVALADDLALALAAPRIRIQAPVPGRSFLGIEVPNDEMTLVALRDIMESEAYQRGKKPLSFALGRDVSGLPASADLANMPHLLIAGTTGSGKSVCVNSILTSFLLNNTPDDLRLVLVDPKRVELTGYNGVPHLLAPVVVEMDRVVGALQWMTREMDRRYHMFAQMGSRNITDYNARLKEQGQKKLPYLVIIVDELADLMMLAPDETERTITRLAQLARATGIHLILATQRPSVDVVTGLIKANFPARVAFAVASNTDSRVILDQPGAERLLGRGDMLYQAPEAPAPVRLQGVFVSDREIHRLVEFWQQQAGVGASIIPGGAVDGVPAHLPLKQVPLWDENPAEKTDPILKDAIDLVRREGRASVSMLQRRMRIGYTRAARLIDEMEEKGIVGAPESTTQVREVLDYGDVGRPAED
jgi:DNA segregation ATPase FtsK/SpoIIIE, S-DNA-T family